MTLTVLVPVMTLQLCNLQSCVLLAISAAQISAYIWEGSHTIVDAMSVQAICNLDICSQLRRYTVSMPDLA